MSSHADWTAVEEARASWRAVDDAVRKLKRLHADLQSLHEAAVRQKADQTAIDAVSAAVDGLDDPGEQTASVDFLTDPLFEGDRTVAEAFRQDRTVPKPVDAVVSGLVEYGETGRRSALHSPLRAVYDPDGWPATVEPSELAALDETVTLVAMAIDAATQARENRADTLQTKLAAAYEGIEGGLPSLSDQPIALFPVRLETRFVDDQGTTDGDPTELLIRVYPDQIHTDSHESALTDEEVRWGKRFWATLWLGNHVERPGDISLRQDLPSDALREYVEGIDTSKFSSDDDKRYRELKERAWKQLIDRFGRERAAHVVHALEPEDDGLVTVLQAGPEADHDQYSEEIESAHEEHTGWSPGELTFPDVDRRPDSWTKPPRASMLPDRWLVIAEWELMANLPERAAFAGPPIREPLPVGPNPESVSERHPDRDDPTPKGMEWMTDFEAAEEAGMGIRIDLDGLSGLGTDPEFTRLTVVGVRSSVDPETTATDVGSLLDAHHYTDGLELLPQGTPTNNYDESSGYTRSDDPLDSMETEAGPPLIESGDKSDGDLLARALAIDPDVFVHVAGADATEQRDARHVNRALWPATMGYYLDHVAVDNALAVNQPLFSGGGDGDPLTRHLLWSDAWRRHFVRYVRGRGPFPTLRVGKQPYGITPVTAVDTERSLDVVDLGLVRDLQRGRVSADTIPKSGLSTMVGGGIDPSLLVESGADPDDMLAAGASPEQLVEGGGVDPESVLDATDLAPEGLTQDGVGLLETSRLTEPALDAAGVPVDDLEAAGVSIRDLARGDVDDEQLSNAGVTTEALAEAVLPRQARKLGITPAALDDAGITPGALLRGEITAEQVAALDISARTVAEAVLPEAVREAGLTPRAVAEAGISASDLLNGTVSASDLQAAGVTTEALAEALLPEAFTDVGITPEAVGEAVSLADLFNGDVIAEDLTEVGLTTESVLDAALPQAVEDAGITASSLEDAGITPDAVLNGQVTPADVAEAGVTPTALAKAGVLPDALSSVGSAVGDLLEAGLDPSVLIERGLSVDSLVSAGVDPGLLVDAGLAPKRLVEAGLSAVDLATAQSLPIDSLLSSGASVSDLARVGAAAEQVAAGDIPAQELVRAGFAAADLLSAGADALGVAQGGARPSTLRAAGVDAGTLRDAGKAAGSMRRAGYEAAELLESGYTPEELLNGGFSAADLEAAGVDASTVSTGRSAAELIAAGTPPEQLRSEGYDPKTLFEAGLDAAGLVAAGYTAGELVDAGIDPSALVEAGASVEQLQAADVDVATLVEAGATVDVLSAAGVSAETLLAAGLEAEALADGGYSDAELRAAGVDPASISDGSDQSDGESDPVDGLPYAATVAEAIDRSEREQYAFSFDPALPRSGTDPAETADDRVADGGATSVAPVNKQLSLDDRLDDRLVSWLTGLDRLWGRQADFVDTARDESGLLETLQREGLSTGVDITELVYSGEGGGSGLGHEASTTRSYVRSQQLPTTKRRTESAIELYGADGFDPRLAYLYATDREVDGGDIEVYLPENTDTAEEAFECYHFGRTQRTISAIQNPSALVDDDIGSFVDLLCDAPIQTLQALVPEMDTVPTVDESALSTDSDESTMDLRNKIVRAIHDSDSPSQLAGNLITTDTSGETVDKLITMAISADQYGDSGVLWSLLRQLLNYGTIEAYLAARQRLGHQYDDPIPSRPQPAYFSPETPDPMEALYDEAPDPVQSHPALDDAWAYDDVLERVAGDDPETTSIDPALSEYFDSLEYVGDIDVERLRTLVRETFDVCSYRLDAWWTSLATKRLFELRERQQYGDVIDHLGDVPRATADPSQLSGLDVTSDPASFDTATLSNTTIATDSGDATGADVTDTGGDDDQAPTGDGGRVAESRTLSSLVESGDVATRDASALVERDSSEQADPGLYVGAYGFVEHLSPDTGEQDGPQYVHAPSEQQATTAAIMRSGYDAHAGTRGWQEKARSVTDGEVTESMLSVGLSPDRVRQAQQLLRAVRRGQSLAQRFGYRFERGLREATLTDDGVGLMQYLPVFREAFPAKSAGIERPDDPGNGDDVVGLEVVDGRKLITDWESYPFGRGGDLPPEDSDDYRAMADIVAGLEDRLSAVNDLLTAESVHQFTQGNVERAGGSIAALTRGEALPEPEITKLPRSETRVVHRQTLLFGTPDPGSDATPRTKAEPALSAWVDNLLPDDTDVECRATYRWEETETLGDGLTDVTTEHSQETTITLSELSLGPLDVLLLFGTDSEGTRTELEQRFVYRLIRNRPDDVPIDADVDLYMGEAKRSDAVSAADTLELCRSIRALIGKTRPADAEDLVHPSDARTTGYDDQTVRTLTSRANAAQDELETLIGDIDGLMALISAAHDPGDGTASLPDELDAPSDGNLTSSAVDAATGSSTLSEQAEAVGDATDSIVESVPLSTAASVADALDPAALQQELAAFADAIPITHPERIDRLTDRAEMGERGGSGMFERIGEDEPSRDESSEDRVLTVEAAPDQRIRGVLGEPPSVPVGAGEALDQYREHDLPVDDDEWVQYYADRIDALSTQRDPATMRDGEPPTEYLDWQGTTVTVVAWGTAEEAFFGMETTATCEREGAFEAALDFSSVEPGTPFRVAAVADGTVVYSGRGYVAGRQEADFPADFHGTYPNLARLLWLHDRRGAFYDAPFDELGAANAALDNAAVDAQRGKITTDGPLTQADRDALQALADIEDLDTMAMVDAVGTLSALVDRLGLDEVVDTYAPSGVGPADASYELTDIERLVRLRPALLQVAANPVQYNDGADRALLPYDPTSAATIRSMDEAEAVTEHLLAVLSLPDWVLALLDCRGDVDAVQTLRDLSAWLYPRQDPPIQRFAQGLEGLAEAVATVPVLDRTLDVDDVEVADRFDQDGTPASVGSLATVLSSVSSRVATVPSVPSAADARKRLQSDLDGAATTVTDEGSTAATTLPPLTDGHAARAVRAVLAERLRQPMTVAASYGIYGGTPESPAGGRPEDLSALVEQGHALLERLRERLRTTAALDPRLDDTSDGKPVDVRMDEETERLETLFDEAFTVLPPFEPGNGAELEATFTDTGLVPDDRRRAAETWFHRAAEFRDRIDDFREQRSYVEMLSKSPTRQFTLGQVPYEPGDTWVGADGVDPQPGKLSLVTQFGPGVTPGTADQRLTGLFVDEYTESIPEESETTGVALNYDDPGARAPQSILVATPPEEGSWTLDDLAEAVAETADYAKYRAVDVGDMHVDYEALLPALYMPRTDYGDPPKTPSVNVETIFDTIDARNATGGESDE